MTTSGLSWPDVPLAECEAVGSGGGILIAMHFGSDCLDKVPLVRLHDGIPVLRDWPYDANAAPL